MADRITARVDAATGKFIDDGRPADGRTILEVTVPRNPDVTRDRYSGDAGEPIRSATAEEIAAAVGAKKLAAARAEANSAPFLRFFMAALCDAIVTPVPNETGEELQERVTAAALQAMVQAS